jgi:hypothetical protein
LESATSHGKLGKQTAMEEYRSIESVTGILDVQKGIIISKVQKRQENFVQNCKGKTDVEK